MVTSSQIRHGLVIQHVRRLRGVVEAVDAGRPAPAGDGDLATVHEIMRFRVSPPPFRDEQKAEMADLIGRRLAQLAETQPSSGRLLITPRLDWIEPGLTVLRTVIRHGGTVDPDTTRAIALVPDTVESPAAWRSTVELAATDLPPFADILAVHQAAPDGTPVDDTLIVMGIGAG